MENAQRNQSEDLNVMEKIENADDASCVASFSYHHHVTLAANKDTKTDNSLGAGPCADKEVNDTNVYGNPVMGPSVDEEVNAMSEYESHVTEPSADEEINDMNADENYVTEPSVDDKVPSIKEDSEDMGAECMHGCVSQADGDELQPGTCI